MCKKVNSQALQFITAILVLVWPVYAHASFPEKEKELLFFIERNRDKDEVWYTLNLDNNGMIQSEKPVKVFWMRKSGDNSRDPLTRVQKKFSYGIHSVERFSLREEKWSFKLAAYKDREFVLKRDLSGAFKVYTISENKLLEVQKMYVAFDGGSFLAPSIGYVELYGIDSKSGKVIKETLPGKE